MNHQEYCEHYLCVNKEKGCNWTRHKGNVLDHQEICEIAGQNEILKKVVKNVEGLILNTAMCREMN